VQPDISDAGSAPPAIAAHRRAPIATRACVVAGVVAMTLLGCAPRDAVREERFDGGRLDSVRVFAGTSAPTRLILLFSPDSGWTTEWTDMARTLARHGMLVAGVDLAAYRRRLAASGDGCHYLVADFEALSKTWTRSGDERPGTVRDHGAPATPTAAGGWS
jgi:type IV secretory pathway VirJ component